MRIAKWIAGIVGAVVLVLVAAVYVLTMVIDPNQYRGRIEQLVRDASGRPFEIEGDLEVAWFPWLAIRTGPAELGNPPGVDGPPLARWRSLSAGARLVPLLRGELILDRIRLEGAEVNLIRSADGRTNWDDLLGQTTSDSQEPKEPDLAGLEIRDGSLRFFDEQNGRDVRLSNWRLDVGAWKSAGWVHIKSELTLTDAMAIHPLTADVRLDTRVYLATEIDRLQVRDAKLEGRLRGETHAQAGVPFRMDLPELAADLGPASLDVPRFEVEIAGVRLRGSMEAKEQDSVLWAGGPLSVEVRSLRELLADLGIKAPLPKDPETLQWLTLDTTWAFESGAVTLNPVSLQIDSTRLNGEVYRSAGPEAIWRFDLKGDRIDLGRYMVTEDTSDKPFELPLDMLRALKVQGSLMFDQAQLADAEMRGVRLRLVMADGKLSSAANRGALR